jgi:phosphate/phosphite/phosphonate ABC transporter binding protein
MKHTLHAAGLAAFACLGLSACDNRPESTSPLSPEPSPAPAPAPAEKPVLRFSAIPDQDKTELKEKFDAWAEHLTAALDVPVEYVPASDYKASVEMFRNGDIQLAWFGGLTGVQARHAVDGARAIAQGKADPQYLSYFIAHKDTGLTESDEFPTDLAMRTFTFGSESSTSGRLMPEFFIRQNTGKSPKSSSAACPAFPAPTTRPSNSSRPAASRPARSTTRSTTSASPRAKPTPTSAA